MASRNSHNRPSNANRAGRRGVGRVRSVLLTIALGAASLMGCAQHPVHQLYHATAISYVPTKSALHPQMSTPSVVQPFAHGFNTTRWHAWAEEWGEEIEMLPEAAQQPQELMPAPPTAPPHVAPVPN